MTAEVALVASAAGASGRVLLVVTLALGLAGGACRWERRAGTGTGTHTGTGTGDVQRADSAGQAAGAPASGAVESKMPAGATTPSTGSTPAAGSKGPGAGSKTSAGTTTGPGATGSKAAPATGATPPPVLAQATGGKRAATPPGLGPRSLDPLQPAAPAPDAGAVQPGSSAGRPAALTPAELLAETAQPRPIPGGPDAGRRVSEPEVVAAEPAGAGTSADDQKPARRAPTSSGSTPPPAIGGDPLPIPGAEITFQSARVRRFLDSGGASLDGRVVDADTDKAVGNADIEAWMGTRSVEAETDELGRFRFEGLIPGSRLTLWITSAPTYVQERTEVVVPEQKPSFQATFRLLDRASNAAAVDGGAGLFLSRRGNRTVVTGLAAFGSAERAGVRVNDAIVAVGKRKVLDLGPGAIDYLLRGTIGTQLELTVQTGSESPRKVLLQRTAR